MRTQFVRRSLALSFLLGVCVQSAEGAIVTYSSRSAWTTGAGGGTGIIVDSLDSGGLTRAGYTISGTGASFPNSNSQTSVDGTSYLRALLRSLPTQSTVILTFSSPIRALGYDLNSQDTNLGAAVNFAIDGTPSGTYTLPGTDVTGFQGFVSTTPFTSITLTTTDSFALHGIDNLEAFSAVPEPAGTAWVVSLAMGAVVLARRRIASC